MRGPLCDVTDEWGDCKPNDIESDTATTTAAAVRFITDGRWHLKISVVIALFAVSGGHSWRFIYIYIYIDVRDIYYYFLLAPGKQLVYILWAGAVQDNIIFYYSSCIPRLLKCLAEHIRVRDNEDVCRTCIVVYECYGWARFTRDFWSKYNTLQYLRNERNFVFESIIVILDWYY